MLNRILLGAIAGAAATGPQSTVLWGLRRAGVYRRRVPPEVVTEKVADATVGIEHVPESLRGPGFWAGHVGYGAAGGALYGLLTAKLPANALTGALAGLGVYAGSYLGWLPAAHIMPPARDDEEGRQLALILAHLAYGASMGITLRRLTRRE